MAHDEHVESRVRAVAALEQPLRRDLYRLLAERGGWLSRDEAAAALGVARSVAAFHLDKLAEAGVVEITFERTSGRSGPGAGRPAKLYRRHHDEVSASIPARHYDLAALLLAGAVEEAAASGRPVEGCLRDVARGEGRRIGALSPPAGAGGDEGPEGAPGSGPGPGFDLDTVARAIAPHGYEPEVFDRCEVALRNCPFHRLADQHRSLVCGMNLALLGGVLEGMGLADRLEAHLRPEPGWCCVRITTGP